MKKSSAHRPRGWWDTPEVREDFFKLTPRELAEKYAIQTSYVSHLRRRMREHALGTVAAPEAQTETEKMGAEILALRLESGLSQAEFGQLVYSHRNSVIAWESGRAPCPPEKLELLRLKLQKTKPVEITITINHRKIKRSVTLVVGGVYMIEPINPEVTRQRGRLVKIAALPYGDSKDPYKKAAVIYLDSGKPGSVRTRDLVSLPDQS